MSQKNFTIDTGLTINDPGGNIDGVVDISISGNIVTNSGNLVNDGQTWNFGADGNLTLPSDTSSINYANGSPYGGTTNPFDQDLNTTDSPTFAGLSLTGNITLPDGSVLDTANTVHIGQTPDNKGDGNLWYNSDDGRGYVKYNDQWIDFSPAVIPNPATYLGNLTIENSTLTFPPGGNIEFGDGSVQTTAFTGSIDLTQVASNIIPASNIAYSLGNATNQWKDLWVSNSTIYINSVPVTIDGTTLQVDGSNVVTASSDGTVDLSDISVTGNVTASYFIGDGSMLSNLQVSGSAPVSTTGNVAGGNLIATGTVSASGNITANYFFGNGSQLTGLPATYGNANVVANLAALGSNPVSTTGNITAGNFIGTFVAPATTANTYVLFNDANAIGGSAVFTFNKSGNILTIGTTGGTLKVADISTPQAGVNLRFIPSSGTTLSYGHLNPQFANTYDLGSSSGRWNNVYANVVNAATITAIANITGGNLVTSGLISATGNVTGNYLFGNGSQLTGLPATYGDANVATFLADLGSNTISTTGNVSAGNVTLNGNLTVNGSPIYGVPASYAKYTRTTTQTGITNNSVIVCNVSEAAFGSDIAVDTSTGNVTLQAGRTYRVRGTAGSMVNNGNPVGGAWRWYNATAAAYVGEIGTTMSPAAGNYNAGAIDTAEVVITPNVTTVLQLQIVSVSNFSTIGAATSIEGGYPWIDIEVIGGQAPITAFSTAGNVTGGNVLTGGIVSATGNITGNYILGNGSQLTGLPATYGNSNVATFMAAYGSNTISSTGNITSGNISVVGTAVTGINAVLAGPTFTPLANTAAGFVANVNNYTQITFQNKSTGADATADYILTADNGSDTVNYGDFGIINSGYDNNTPTNSLGNIVFAADTYLYAQGNVNNTSQSGGNLVIGTAVATKNVKIFAGGNTNSALVANISNTGIAVTGVISATGNVTAQNFFGNISITGNVQGTSANVSLVAGSYTATFDNTGVLTLPTNGGDEGGEIRLGIPATNTTLTSRVTVDVYRDSFRIFDGSTKGAYIDLSQSAAGVGTLLNNRVGTANLALNTSLTFDNLAVQIRTQSSGVWIFLATVSGSATYQYAITYQLSGGGSAQGTVGTMSATTTPATVGSAAWYFSTAASQATVTISDTTNNKMYRVTWQTTTGSSPYGNFVSIERLI